MTSNSDLNLVLASTSAYRRALLERLGLPFGTSSPHVDETPRAAEAPERLVRRLAEAKARAVADDVGPALVVGSDQVAVLDGDVLGKPGTPEKAFEQLARASGRAVEFLTGLCLLNTSSGHCQVECESYIVHFRPLSADQIRRYVEAEKPYDCAGSFKSEGLGIVLFSRMEGNDPNALIGLPLIRLVSMLEREGVELP